MVPLARASFYTPPRMQGFWSDNDAKMLTVVVESSRRMDGKSTSNVEGFPQYHHKRGH
jgi:hypothetical protein